MSRLHSSFFCDVTSRKWVWDTRFGCQVQYSPCLICLYVEVQVCFPVCVTELLPPKVTTQSKRDNFFTTSVWKKLVNHSACLCKKRNYLTLNKDCKIESFYNMFSFSSCFVFHFGMCLYQCFHMVSHILAKFLMLWHSLEIIFLPIFKRQHMKFNV